MKNSSLKRFLFSGILILCGLAGGLLSCGRKELLAAKKETYSQRVSINGELQWKSGFYWDFFPQSEDVDDGKIGYFVPEEDRKQRLKTVKQFQGIINNWVDNEKIEVFHDVLSEEDFFALINSRARELSEKYTEEEVGYRINVSTETDQFVQLDADKEHWLYIRNKDSVYALYGEMRSRAWQNFLEEWLFTLELKWDGLVVMKEEGIISDTHTGYLLNKGMRRMLQYGEEHQGIRGEVLLFHRQEDGVYFKTKCEDVVEEVVLCETDICLEFDDWEEAVSYFVERYPDMYSMEVGFYSEQALWDYEKQAFDQAYYKIKEPEGDHGVFLWNSKVCEVISRREPDYYSYFNMETSVRIRSDYNYNAGFLWEKTKDGSIAYEDLIEGKYSYIKDLGNGNVIRLQAEIIEKEGDGLWDKVVYGVEIFDEEKNKLLQEIQVDSLYSHNSPFGFGDFNVDGYLDLTVAYYHGKNRGTDRHYIFSPSRGKFVQLDSELDSSGSCYGDYETRRVDIHYDGRAITYQWKNEMDYEIVKCIDYDWLAEKVQVKITRYENGKEEILSEYLYSYEEYEERESGIWDTYYHDFTWEKEVTDRTTGKKYMIRYAEVSLQERIEKYKAIYCEGGIWIYVYDEDTYLVSVTHSDIVSESESVEWKVSAGDKEQALVIHYADGGESAFYLSELVQPDYQPDERLPE